MLKRKIISSSFFWKIRHYFQPEWIESYDLKPTPNYLIEFALSKKITSVLDFGCATGNFLYELKKKNIKTLCYGIEINKKALKVSNQKFKELGLSEKTFFFDSETNIKKIINFLNTNNIHYFDLIVFDRSLYCLNEKEINKQFSILKNYAKFILINDFLLDESIKYNGYRLRNWISIMENFKFVVFIN